MGHSGSYGFQILLLTERGVGELENRRKNAFKNHSLTLPYPFCPSLVQPSGYQPPSPSSPTQVLSLPSTLQQLAIALSCVVLPLGAGCLPPLLVGTHWSRVGRKHLDHFHCNRDNGKHMSLWCVHDGLSLFFQSSIPINIGTHKTMAVI
jgi:hypothetical protein